MVGDEAELVGVDALADVLRLAVLRYLIEVVEAVGHHGARIIDLEVLARELVGEILRPVAETVVVVVRDLRRDRLEVEVVRIGVGNAVAVGVNGPRIGGRHASVEILDERKAARAAVKLGEAVVELPRTDRRVVDVRRHRIAAEHRIEFPAVEDAVLVVVGVKGLERILRPLAVDVHVLFVADAERRKVANDEVLVERGERLGVDRVIGDDRRLRVEAKLAIDLRVDERDRAGRDLGHAVRLVSRRRERRLGAASVVVNDSVFAGDRVFVDLVERIAVDRVAGLGRLLAVLEDVADRVGAIGVLHRHDGVVLEGERHHVSVGDIGGVVEIGIEVCELDLPAVGHAVAVGIPDGSVGRIAVLLLVEKSVLVAVAARCAAGSLARGLHAVGDFVAVVVRVLDEDGDGRAAVDLVRDGDALRREDRDAVGVDVA